MKGVLGLFLRRWMLMSLFVALLFEQLPRSEAASRRLLRRRRPAYEIMTNDKPTQAPCELVFVLMEFANMVLSPGILSLRRILPQLRRSALLRRLLIRGA